MQNRNRSIIGGGWRSPTYVWLGGLCASLVFGCGTRVDRPQPKPLEMKHNQKSVGTQT